MHDLCLVDMVMRLSYVHAGPVVGEVAVREMGHYTTERSVYQWNRNVRGDKQ